MKSSAALRRLFVCVVSILVLGVALTGSLTCLAGDVDWSDLIRQATPAVVFIQAQVEGGTASGSGAIISPNGYILTAAHVIEGASSITVIVEEEHEYRATISQVDYDMDIAVLKISASNLTWLALGDVDALIPDQEIRLLGYPRPSIGFGMIMGHGVFLGHRATSAVDLLQIEISPFDHGHSGGPIINANGEVVGVAVGASVSAESLFPELGEEGPYVLHEHQLAVSVDSAREIIPSWYLPTDPSPVQAGTTAVTTSVIHVPGDYPDLATAVSAAPPGAEIQVAAGSYEGDVRFTQPITVTGEDGASIVGTLRVRGTSDVWLESLEVQGTVDIRSSTSVVLEGLVIEESLDAGISIDGSSASIIRCVIRDCGGIGVAAAFDSSLTISDSEILRNSGDGISLSFNSQLLVRDNTIAENDGLGIIATPDCVVIGGANLGWANAAGAGDDTVPQSALPCLRLPEDVVELSRIPAGSEGSLLVVSPGTYVHPSNLVIDASLTLRGGGAAPEDAVLVVRSSLGIEGDVVVTLANLTISSKGFSFTNPDQCGLQVKDSARVTLQDCIVCDSTGYGVWLDDSSHCIFENCVIRDNDSTGIRAWGGQVTMDDCGVSGNNHHGVKIDNGARLEMTDCAVSQNDGTGISSSGGQIAMDGCQVSGNRGRGVEAHSVVRLEMIDCTVSQNDGTGIRAWGEQITMDDCEVSENQELGVEVKGVVRLEMTDCTVSQNDSTGISAWGEQITMDDCEISENQELGVEASSGGRLEMADCTVAQNDGTGISASGGIIAMDSCQVSGNRGRGVEAENAAWLEMTDCTVSQNGESGLRLEEDTVCDLTDTVISSNEEHGIQGWEAQHLSVQSCTVSGNSKNGLYIDGCEDLVIDSSHISNNTEGISLYDAVEASIQSTSIRENGGSAGILLWGGRDVVVEGCEIVGNSGYGLDLDVHGAGVGLVVSDCVIAEHERGGILYDESTRFNTTPFASIQVIDTQILDNLGYGIYLRDPCSGSFAGSGNTFHGNGADLGGYAPADLRDPLVPQSASTSLAVPEDFSTLQEAIDAIAPGGTITLDAGVYVGGFTIWKPLTIQGAASSSSVIEAMPGRTRLISIPECASSVELKELAVRGSMEDGIVSWAENLALSDCWIGGNGSHGLSLNETTALDLFDNRFQQNRGCAVYGYNCDDMTVSVEGNMFLENGAVVGGSAPKELWEPTAAQTDQDLIAVPGDYPTIQEGIDAVAPGGTVTVAAGTWTGGLVISKPVTIQGAGSDQTLLVGLSGTGSVGVWVWAGTGQVILRDLAVSKSRTGVLADGGDVEIVMNSVRISECSHRGGDIRNAAAATLQQCEVVQNGEGISCEGTAAVALQDCEVVSNRGSGVLLDDCAKSTIINTELRENGYDGLSAYDVNLVDLKQCVISDNGDDGVHVSFWSDSTRSGTYALHMEDTLIVRNARVGLFCSEEFFVTGRGNIIPGPEDPDGNKEGSCCDRDWAEHALAVLTSPNTSDWPVVFADDFTDSSSGWEVQADDATTSAYVEGGYEIDYLTGETCLAFDLPVDAMYADFSVDLVFEILEGEGHVGLAFRLAGFMDEDVLNDFYLVLLSTDGLISLHVKQEGEWHAVGSYSTGSPLPQGANRLGIVAVGDTVWLSLNQDSLVLYRDSTFTSGRIGVGVGPCSQVPFTVRITHIEVREPL